MIVIVKRKFFLPDYDYDYDCYSVKKTDYDYDYSEKNGNRLPNRLPIEGDYTSLCGTLTKKKVENFFAIRCNNSYTNR
jgi:hypothetical protein